MSSTQHHETDDEGAKPSRLLDARAVCERLGGSRPINPATWYRGVAAGVYPRPLHFGRIARWREEEIEALIQQRDAARDDKLHTEKSPW